MTPCSKCDRPAVEHVRYAGMHLCADHLRRYVEARAKRSLRDQVDLDEGTLAVATSGGKDSLVCLRICHDVYGVRRGVDVVAVTVDEGIADYRGQSLDHARRVADELGVRHEVVAFEDRVDVTMDALVDGDGLDGTPCATCGVLRRRFLDEAAAAVDADWVATGHNLDDVAQSVLMNVVRGDVKGLARLGPHDEAKAGMVPRLLPLRRIPEREVALYAKLVGLPVQYDACPHSDRAFRGEIRDVLHDLEAGHPGTRHAIVSLYDTIASAVAGSVDQGEVGTCPSCGGPSSGGRCRACVLLEGLDGAGLPDRVGT